MGLPCAYSNDIQHDLRLHSLWEHCILVVPWYTARDACNPQALWVHLHLRCTGKYLQGSPHSLSPTEEVSQTLQGGIVAVGARKCVVEEVVP